ncbi:family 78 glycoside hydrolase [Cryphonectria parasitica EP155]|uniref:Family 78 glycoside hydrolase n=1 Tax=Cryphonectria parasitica (strain ATCC 38755 / EP155) TaxID=660469 RepID=A0A9P4YA72_CRYP1|nr:family 78 glycoside hydrolase [Cryphonectria parasitica EP155]KAF3769316.1 family 78 glycoside hydrolase [Cryphonectria parasitica EP155]
MFERVLLVPLLLAGLVTAASPPYAEYILAPESRKILPAAIHRVNGTVSNAQSLVASTNGSAVLRGNSSITFDYKRNIGGVVSVTVGSVSSSDAVIGLTFTESSLWINGLASDATADAGLDTPLWLDVGAGPGTYTVAREFDRGAFRYLSVVSHSSAAIEVESVAVHFTAAPTQDLRSYAGYFHSNDELLNRIWYAGAYTTQLCSIDPHQGNSLIWLHIINSTEVIELPETITWYNNYTITNRSTALVDGAKRDRLVWPGDIVVTGPSIFVSTNDMSSLRNSLDSLLLLQNASGAMPYAGVPFWEEVGGTYSFTYHLHGLLDIALLYEYTNDLAYLQSVWKNFTLGLEFSIGHIDDTGLMNVTTSGDWLRIGMGGHNIEANAILYYTLNKGIQLANILNATSYATSWTTIAAKIKTAANTLLWDNTTSLYHDNETTTLSPQDGNAWAVHANLTQSAAQSKAVAAALRARWGTYGAPAPEAGGTPATVSPFIGYFELLAHHAAGNASAALELTRLQWGFMLDDPRMTNSTFIEGYASDGSLHYAAYTNDARVSHAHGWSTGPTSVLTMYTAGLRLAAAGGTEWVVAPRLGGLVSVEAGYVAPVGRLEVQVEADAGTEVVTALWLSTPEGTVGSVSLPGVTGRLEDVEGNTVALVDGEASGVPGGNWTLVPA